MTYFSASSSDLAQFHSAGYYLAESLFSSEEIQLLSTYARADQEIHANASSRSDASGGTTTLSLSNDLGDNLYASVVRSQRVAGNMSQFLGDEVYHYHHKMMLKEPLVGGAWGRIGECSKRHGNRPIKSNGLQSFPPGIALKYRRISMPQDPTRTGKVVYPCC